MRRLLAAGAAAFLVVLGFGSTAHAADGVDIDHVEVTDDGTVSVLVGADRLPGGTPLDPDQIEVTVDGEPVEAEAADTGGVERTTVLALDASRSMAGQRIEDAKQAAKAFIAAAPDDVRIGLLTFSGTVQETIEPTTDHATLNEAIDGIELTLGTLVYDAVVESVALAGDEGARSVLLLSDGKDEGGGAPLEDAVAAADEADTVVDVVALEQRPQHRALLDQIAEASGGAVVEADTPAALEQAFAAQADALARQVLVQFPRPEGAADEVDLAVSVSGDGDTFSDSAFVPLGSSGSSGPESVTVEEPLVGKTALLIGGAALGLGLAGILAVVLVGNRGQSRQQRRLAAYLGEKRSNQGDSELSATESVKQSAVGYAERVVKGDFESKLTQKLAGGGSQLTAAEWVLVHAGIAIGAAFVGFVLGDAVLMVLFLLAGLLLPMFYLNFKHSRRLAAFNAQLAETLNLMAGGLQAGLSLPQAIDTVVQEGHQPMAGELSRALVEQRLGVDITEALDNVAERMQSEDFEWIVMAIRIQREVGGNLAEVLSTVAETLREREYLRRQVKTLSAEGRISAYILAGLPPLIFVYMLVVNRDYVRPLYTELLGWLLLAGAAVLLTVGGWFMSRMVKVEV